MPDCAFKIGEFHFFDFLIDEIEIKRTFFQNQIGINQKSDAKAAYHIMLIHMRNVVQIQITVGHF